MIKVDRSFVSDLAGDSDNIAIVAAIISMAHDLDLKVVAEGVETELQLAFLSNLLCDEMQGICLVARFRRRKPVNF